MSLLLGSTFERLVRRPNLSLMEVLSLPEDVVHVITSHMNLVDRVRWRSTCRACHAVDASLFLELAKCSEDGRVLPHRLLRSGVVMLDFVRRELRSVPFSTPNPWYDIFLLAALDDNGPALRWGRDTGLGDIVDGAREDAARMCHTMSSL